MLRFIVVCVILLIAGPSLAEPERHYHYHYFRDSGIRFHSFSNDTPHRWGSTKDEGYEVIAGKDLRGAICFYGKSGYDLDKKENNLFYQKSGQNCPKTFDKLIKP